MSRSERVIVIGAGVSGLEAARQMADRGAEVTVIEARERIGGRIHTDTSLGVPVDLGASWIHGLGKKNPVQKLAEELGLPFEETDLRRMHLFDRNGPLDRDAARRTAETAWWMYDWIETLYKKYAKGKRKPDLSIAAAMARELEKRGGLDLDDARAFDWGLHLMKLDEGISLADVSLKGWWDGEEFGEEEAVMVRGYGALVEALADTEGVTLRLGEVVREVRHTRWGAHVITDREELEADAVVVTLPLGVLKRGDVLFDPPLPEDKRDAIRQLGFGTLDKVIVRFDAQHWPEDVHYVAKLDDPVGGATCGLSLTPFTGEPVLMLFYGGRDAEEMESRSIDEVSDEVMAQLRLGLGADLPEPDAVLRTRWAQDPFARGAYSHIPVGVSPACFDALARPIDNRVFFAGEATSREYNATVHGALLSGRRAAKQAMGR